LLKSPNIEAISQLDYLYSSGYVVMHVTKIISPIESAAKTLYNRIPDVNISKNSVINSVAYIGRKWTSPQQRLIMGATAVFMQPVIDAKNKHVDNETKKVSVAKTISKIVIGTLTGFAVRYLCIKGIKSCSVPLEEISKELKPFAKKMKTILTPDGYLKESDELQQYRNTMGTLISLGIMLFTNFAIDAPLTNKMTNFLIKKPETKQMLSKFIGEEKKAEKGDKS